VTEKKMADFTKGQTWAPQKLATNTELPYAYDPAVFEGGDAFQRGIRNSI
jgi:hypothetical protein